MDAWRKLRDDLAEIINVSESTLGDSDDECTFAPIPLPEFLTTISQAMLLIHRMMGAPVGEVVAIDGTMSTPQVEVCMDSLSKPELFTRVRLVPVARSNDAAVAAARHQEATNGR